MNLNEIQKAVIALDIEDPHRNQPPGTSETQTRISRQTAARRPGLIGEGRKAPLSASQRRRALQLEQARQPLIFSNPEFASNPFHAIRTHAQNTLMKHEPPT